MDDMVLMGGCKKLSLQELNASSASRWSEERITSKDAVNEESAEPTSYHSRGRKTETINDESATPRACLRVQDDVGRRGSRKHHRGVDGAHAQRGDAARTRLQETQ